MLGDPFEIQDKNNITLYQFANFKQVEQSISNSDSNYWRSIHF